MSALVEIIESAGALRDTPIEDACASLPLGELLREAEALEAYRRRCPNLYQRVRAQFFLSSMHRYHVPAAPGAGQEGLGIGQRPAW